ARWSTLSTSASLSRLPPPLLLLRHQTPNGRCAVASPSAASTTGSALLLLLLCHQNRRAASRSPPRCSGSVMRGWSTTRRCRCCTSGPPTPSTRSPAGRLGHQNQE